jgi:hypothetical protein
MSFNTISLYVAHVAQVKKTKQNKTKQNNGDPAI